MNKCTEIDIREMLPDLLHGKLDASARARVEAHVASCDECTEELEVLRTVKSAAVFIPPIDVDRVVRQIPPYRVIVPAAQAPARTRVVSWLVAASLAVVVLGGGSLLMIQQKPSAQRVVIHDGPDQQRAASRLMVPKRVPTVAQKPPVMPEPRPHALAMATGAIAGGIVAGCGKSRRSRPWRRLAAHDSAEAPCSACCDTRSSRSTGRYIAASTAQACSNRPAETTGGAGAASARSRHGDGRGRPERRQSAAADERHGPLRCASGNGARASDLGGQRGQS